MPQPVALVIHGAAGRMGQALLRLAHERADVEVVAAIVRNGSDHDGHSLPASGGSPQQSLRYSSTHPSELHADVIIDFAGAAAFDATLQLALDRRVALVSGSTGLSSSQYEALQRAGREIPVLWASNFSLGVAMLARLVAQAAQRLPEWDCEILEMHHRYKLDAPSGTALTLGRAVDAARVNADSTIPTDRDGARIQGSTGYAVVRGGDVVGEHSVMFLGDGERLELVHRATDRDIFARGALAAAAWIARQPPGVHTIDAVIGFDLSRQG